MDNQTKERIEEVERRLDDVEEKIKPKKARTHGDPVVTLLD